MSNKLSKVVNHILYRKINIYELEDGAYSIENDKYFIREIDVHSAIGILVGKLTLFEGLTREIYEKYNDLPLEQIQSYERLFYFVKINCNAELYDALEDACTFIKIYANDLTTSEEFTTQLLNYIILGVAIISCIILMPYIYRAQQSILKILILFLNIKEEEITKKIKHYNEILQKINTHFKKIEEEYKTIDFQVDKSRFARVETEEKKEKSNEATKRSSESNRDENGKEEEVKQHIELSKQTEMNTKIAEIESKK